MMDDVYPTLLARWTGIISHDLSGFETIEFPLSLVDNPSSCITEHPTSFSYSTENLIYKREGGGND